MQKISSKENSLIKHIKKLKEKKYRDEYNEFIIEGTKMLKEALKENAKIDKIVFSESFIENNIIEGFLSEDISPKDIICVPDSIFEMITEVGTPQGTLAIIKKEQEGKPKKVAKVAGMNKFLRIYYARVKELYNNT